MGTGIAAVSLAAQWAKEGGKERRRIGQAQGFICLN